MRAVRHSFSAGAAHDDRKSCPEPNKTVPDPVHGSSLDQATRPRGAPHRHPPSWLSPAHSPGCSRPLPRPQLHGCHSTSLSSIATEVPARAHIARARLELVFRRCPVVLPQHMQGGSRCPGRAVEPERARWHDPVLGRWLHGLTSEQPGLCLRGFPGRLRVDLGRVSDPPGLGRRQGAQRAMYGRFLFPFVICPMEFRNLLNSTWQISTTHPVSSNLTPSPLGSAWVRNHRGLKSAGLGQNSSVPLSEFSSRPFWDLHVIVRILSRPS